MNLTSLHKNNALWKKIIKLKLYDTTYYITIQSTLSYFIGHYVQYMSKLGSIHLNLMRIIHNGIFSNQVMLTFPSINKFFKATLTWLGWAMCMV
jgi:hypothetical protein